VRRLVLTVAVILVLALAAFLTLDIRHIYGVVSDDLTGEAIAGATVAAGECMVHSDSAGHFDLGWTRGALTLGVRVDGYAPKEVQAPRGRFPGQDVPLHIRLTPTTLSGRVYDAETGELLPNAVVSTGGLQAAATDRGHYRFRRILTGSHVRVEVPGYEPETAVFNGRAEQDFRLQPTATTILVLVSYSSDPVADAIVVRGFEHLTTDATGTVTVKRLLKGTELSVSAAGYAAVDFTYDGEEIVSVALRPNILRGVVRDRSSGQLVTGADVSIVCAGDAFAFTATATDGQYAFANLPCAPTTVTVSAAEYETIQTTVGPVTEIDVYLKPFRVKGIYMPLGILVSEARVHGLMDLVERTELNAIVVDIKNDRGWLAYSSDVAVARQSGAYKSEVMDIGEFLSLCQEKDIYVIARLVVFKDSTLVAAYPQWAVRTDSGEIYVDSEGSSWGDPFRQEVWDYNIAIAREVAALGFDELQFDYLRFPSDGSVQKTRYRQDSTRESRCKAMAEFCGRLRRQLETYPVELSADIFGLTAWVSREEDMGIGQRVIDIAPHMDYLSPMLYPATFVEGNLGYDDPTEYPYEIVYRSCVELAERTETRIRPWLQHYRYSVKEMRLQRQAADDAGTRGWMFWNAAGKYDEQVFDPAESH